MLTPEEAQQLELLQAKAAASAPEPAEAAGAVADGTGEAAAAVAEAVGEVAATVATVVATEVADAHEQVEYTLRDDANAARVEAAAAELAADEAIADAHATEVAVVAMVADEVTEDAQPVVVEDGAAAVVVDADEGAEVTLEDVQPSTSPHPYFRPLRRHGRDDR